jgi:hypothetical protein
VCSSDLSANPPIEARRFGSENLSQEIVRPRSGVAAHGLRSLCTMTSRNGMAS